MKRAFIFARIAFAFAGLMLLPLACRGNISSLPCADASCAPPKGGSDEGDGGPADAGVSDAGSGDPVSDAGQDAGPSAADGGSSTCPEGVLCTQKPLFHSKIGIWYTLWWTEGAAAAPWADWSRYQPVAGFYRSGNDPAFSVQLNQFAAMKLDFLLLDHTNGIYGVMQTNGEALVAALERSDSGVRQAVAAGGPLWTANPPDRTSQMREDDYIWLDLANPATHTRAFVPPNQQAPLVVMYTAPGQGDDWVDPRFSVSFATGFASGASTLMRNGGVYGWVFSEPTLIDSKVMGVMPGWNTVHLGRTTTPIPREGGLLFAREWLRAMKQDPDVIIINSWNDFAEETAIEPAMRKTAAAELWGDAYGTECPSIYYDLARQYSLLRWGLEIGAYVREENNTRVYLVTASGLVAQDAMPHCHPILFVPDGYLAQFPLA